MGGGGRKPISRLPILMRSDNRTVIRWEKHENEDMAILCTKYVMSRLGWRAECVSLTLSRQPCQPHQFRLPPVWPLSLPFLVRFTFYQII